MRVVFVSTEVAPWSKVGGLGDFAAALPKHLAAKGHAVMSVAPMYGRYTDVYDTGLRVPLALPLDDILSAWTELGGDPAATPHHMRHAALYMCTRGGVDRVFVDHPLFSLQRGGIYTYGPAGAHPCLDVMYSLLSQAALAAPVLLWSEAVRRGAAKPASSSMSAHAHEDADEPDRRHSISRAQTSGLANSAHRVVPQWEQDDDRRSLRRIRSAEGSARERRRKQTPRSDTSTAVRGGGGDGVDRYVDYHQDRYVEYSRDRVGGVDSGEPTRSETCSESVQAGDGDGMEGGAASSGSLRDDADDNARGQTARTNSGIAGLNQRDAATGGICDRGYADGGAEPAGGIRPGAVVRRSAGADDMVRGNGQRGPSSGRHAGNDAQSGAGPLRQRGDSPRDGERALGGAVGAIDKSDKAAGGRAPPLTFIANDWPSAPLVLWLKYHYGQSDVSSSAADDDDWLDEEPDNDDADSDGDRLDERDFIDEANASSDSFVDCVDDTPSTPTTPFSRFAAIPKPSLRAVWNTVSRGLRGAKIAFCLHNGLHQGIFAAEAFPRLGLPASALAALRWPPRAPSPKSEASERVGESSTAGTTGIESTGALNWLTAALLQSDLRLTVSPAYAEELQTDREGFAPAQAIQEAGGIGGILNGLDTSEWDPATDALLPPQARYSLPTAAAGKAAAKAALQAALGLDPLPGVPLVGFVGRLDPQKGVDILLSALPELLGSPAGGCLPPRASGPPERPPPRLQLAALGTGEAWMEAGLEGLAASFPGAAAGRTSFDEGLAHLIIAASDYLLVPSRSEPCGLVALAALRYGALPIVNPVGGLRDIVQPQVNGLHLDFSSRGPASHRAQVRALLDTLDDAVALHGSDRFLAMREAAMTADVSWEAAAAQWEAALAGMMAGGGEGGGGRGAEGSESAAESVDD
eukprot:jgi/Tetstr1/431059/TSEL_020776.t1